VTGTGSLALANVRFEKTEGYAVIVQQLGRLACAAGVDHGGFRYFDSGSRSAVASCPR
jgi:hypothetical protein